MKTTLVLLAVAALAFAVSVPSAAAYYSPLLGGGPSGGDPCNGVEDEACTCGVGVYFCAEGQQCERYVHAVCISG